MVKHSKRFALPEAPRLCLRAFASSEDTLGLPSMTLVDVDADDHDEPLTS